MSLVGALLVNQGKRLILATDSIFIQEATDIDYVAPCIKLRNIGNVWYGEIGSESDIQLVTHYMHSKLEKAGDEKELYQILHELNKELPKKKYNTEFIFTLADTPKAFYFVPKKHLRAIDNYEFIGAASGVGAVSFGGFYHANNWAERAPTLSQGLEAMLETFAEAIRSSNVVQLPIHMIVTSPLEGPFKIEPTDKTWLDTYKRVDERAKLTTTGILEGIKLENRNRENKRAYTPHKF